MKILPKLADDDVTTKGFDVSEGVEFQMLNPNLKESLKQCRAICKTERNIYHLPFGMHDLVYYTYPENKRKLMSLLMALNPYTEKVVAHLDVSPEVYDAMGGITVLHQIRRSIGPVIMLENSITSPCQKDLTTSWAWQVAAECHLPTVVDLTHLIASENLYGLQVKLPQDAAYVHFASCIDGDGVKDKKRTHGRVHKSYIDLFYDLMLLVRHGLDLETAVLTTEVTEDDYVKRPDMTRELEMLYAFRKEYEDAKANYFGADGSHTVSVLDWMRQVQQRS